MPFLSSFPFVFDHNEGATSSWFLFFWFVFDDRDLPPSWSRSFVFTRRGKSLLFAVHSFSTARRDFPSHVAVFIHFRHSMVMTSPLTTPSPRTSHPQANDDTKVWWGASVAPHRYISFFKCCEEGRPLLTIYVDFLLCYGEVVMSLSHSKTSINACF